MSSAQPTQDPRQFVTYRLVRLQSRLNAQAIRILRSNSDLALTEWRIMSLAYGHEFVTLSSLAGQSDLDKGQLSRAATSMIKKGYLASTVNETDHRQNFLSLTDAGVALCDHIFPKMQARQASLTRDVSEHELAVMLGVIGKLEQAANDDL